MTGADANPVGQTHRTVRLDCHGSGRNLGAWQCHLATNPCCASTKKWPARRARRGQEMKREQRFEHREPAGC